MNINVIFPVYNEKLRLENGIEKAVDYLNENKFDYIVTIIDNNSTDETPILAKKLCEKYEKVNYLRIEEQGVGIALKTGIINNTADIVGYMDIDLSTDIKFLGEAIKIFENDASIEYINGSRFSKDSKTVGRKFYRKILSKGLVFLLKSQLKMKATDAVCGFTFMRRDVAKKLVDICGDEKGWFYTIEMLIKAERIGINIYEMPVEFTEDYNSTVKVYKTVKTYLKQIFKLRKELKKDYAKKD